MTASPLALLDHALWADARSHAMLAALPADAPERDEALRLYAHLAAAAHVWHARIAGTEPRHPVWPTLALDEAQALARASLAALRALVADDPAPLARPVTYRTSTGAECTNTVAEIVTHVALHASHHRGQLALLARRAGEAPAATDYIVFAREPATHAAEPAPAADAGEGLDIGGALPILRVADLAASVTYYVDRLGFAVEWRDGLAASVRRDRASIMLVAGDQGHAGTWLWLSTRDVDALYAEFGARGAMLRHPPTNLRWGSRECQVRDPDGHVLRFGSDLRAGEPMGEWLDGAERRWIPTDDGGWRERV